MVVEVVDVVELVDVLVDDVDVLGGVGGGVPMSMMLGGNAGSMNVVEDVATTVVEVDVVDEVVARPAGVVAGTVGGGMHNGCGLVELGAGVELGGALAVASEARAIERVPTATVASSRTATTRPPSSRRPKASASDSRQQDERADQQHGTGRTARGGEATELVHRRGESRGVTG